MNEEEKPWRVSYRDVTPDALREHQCKMMHLYLSGSPEWDELYEKSRQKLIKLGYIKDE